MPDFTALDTTTAMDYVQTIPGLFPPGACLQCREIGDGNINFVFVVRDELSGRSVIIKQALPYLRSSGKDRLLTLDRARIENEALLLEAELAPGLVPAIYHTDKALSLTVMEDLSDHIILRKGLIRRQRYPEFPRQIGTFLARTLFLTSDLALDGKAKKTLLSRFINPEMCEITEKLVFTGPYYEARTTSYTPGAAAAGAALLDNTALKFEVARLKEDFLTRGQALLHGDLHTGSIFVTATSTKVIDPEFAYYGPMGFDVGAIIGNLVLNYAAQAYHSPAAAERADYRAYLLGAATEIWQVFEAEFSRLWDQRLVEITAQVPGYKEDYLRRILQDTCGFGGCKVIRRIGRAQVEDFKAIPDETIRGRAEVYALRLGEAMIMERKKVQKIEDLTEMIKSIPEPETV